jgi:predicted MFS family arabinose efflux permease
MIGCDDGYGRSADDQPGHRRGTDEWFGWQAVFWAPFYFGAATMLLAWGDMGRDGVPPISPPQYLANTPELLRALLLCLAAA